MLQHFLAVGGALLVSLWSTVLTQYPHFRTPPPEPAPQIAVAVPQTPTPFQEVVEEIVRQASSTAARPVATTTPTPTRPVGPTTPQTPVVAPPLPVPVIPTPTPPTPLPTVDTQLSDEALLKAAVVNIICLQQGGLKGVSGSGVIVDPRGIVMTVAHIGQQFLLRDYPTEDSGSCYIRTGSPAKNAYVAEPIFISPSWIEENSDSYLSSRPRGTGEHDFAFLAITGSATASPLPSRFAYIPLSPVGTDLSEGDRVGTGSYAAEFLSSSEVRSALYPTLKFADIVDIYTFGSRSEDIFSVAAGSAAQEGSSGGAVINEDGALIGLITTRTVKPDLSLRTMQAISMDHARSSFRADMSENLDSYLRGNLSTLVQNFRGRAVGLLDILAEAMECSQSGSSC